MSEGSAFITGINIRLRLLVGEYKWWCSEEDEEVVVVVYKREIERGRVHRMDAKPLGHLVDSSFITFYIYLFTVNNKVWFFIYIYGYVFVYLVGKIYC